MDRKKALLGTLISSCLISTLAHALPVVTCCPTAPFKKNSFYAGLGVGSTFLNYHTIISEPNPTINLPIYGHGFLGNIQGGYQFTFDKYALAVDGFANMTSQRTGMNRIYGPDGAWRKMQFINNWNAGISLLPGYLLNDFMLAYLRLGYINSHYTVNIKGNGPQQFTNNIPGGQIGLGGEVWFPMLKNFSVRGEFDTIIAPTWNQIGAFNSTNGTRNNAKVNIANNLFQINFIYHFV